MYFFLTLLCKVIRLISFVVFFRITTFVTVNGEKENIYHKRTFSVSVVIYCPSFCLCCEACLCTLTWPRILSCYGFLNNIFDGLRMIYRDQSLRQKISISCISALQFFKKLQIIMQEN